MPYGAGISQVPDFTAGALQSHPCRVDADSEYGRDLRQRMPLDILQQKYLAMTLRQLKRSQDRALKSSWLLQTGYRSPRANRTRMSH